MVGTVRYRAEGAVGRVVFSNPEKRNAMSLAMWEELTAVIAQAVSDAEVRVIALTGDGEQAFVSGSDISGFSQSRSTPAATKAYNDRVEAALSSVADCPKPTVALIRGFCIGGGVGIAAACDLRLADDKSIFAVPAALLGVGYSVQQISRLQHLVGPAHVRDIIFTGRRLKADEAHRAGFLSRILPEADFQADTDTLIAQIGANAPLTIAAAKRASIEALKSFGERDLAAVDALIAACFVSDDYREGQRAFAEKRKPRFVGR